MSQLTAKLQNEPTGLLRTPESFLICGCLLPAIVWPVAMILAGKTRPRSRPRSQFPTPLCPFPHAAAQRSLSAPLWRPLH